MSNGFPSNYKDEMGREYAFQETAVQSETKNFSIIAVLSSICYFSLYFAIFFSRFYTNSPNAQNLLDFVITLFNIGIFIWVLVMMISLFSLVKTWYNTTTRRI
jgi:RsiW-degrading membrane proteinase PrsW (M82 family)